MEWIALILLWNKSNNKKEYNKILYYNIKNFDDIINNKYSRNTNKKYIFDSENDL